MLRACSTIWPNGTAGTCGVTAPSEIQLKTGLEQLMSAGTDRQPELRWGDACIHRYRDRLYVLDFDPAAASESLPSRYEWDGRGVIDMGPARGHLRLVRDDAGGMANDVAANGIVVRFRHGGERIREVNQDHHKRLKKLFQEHGVLPWMRCHVPLVYGHGGRSDDLLAVADLWVAADALAGPGEAGYRILWENHPVAQ
jgi:tRNA(Ile)-lysidine synthase